MEGEQPEWYTWELKDEAEAKAFFEWYESQGEPVALFHDMYTDNYLLAAKAVEDTHVLAGQEVHYDSLVAGHQGKSKMMECVLCHERVQINMVGIRDLWVVFR